MTDYYTVNEYAAMTGKDPGNIRRMLINGIIKGEKIGRQWIIAKNATYPEDRRIKSGKYKNWRKRMKLNRNVPHLIDKLEEMSCKIGQIYENVAVQIVLYGSYARGEQNDESDVDIAVFLKGSDTDQKHDKMLDIVIEYEWELEKTLSVISLDYQNYTEWNKVLPFYRNIEKEGIVLWKAA